MSTLELILSDLVVVEKRMERVDKDRKKVEESPSSTASSSCSVAARQALEDNQPLRELEISRR